MAMSFARNLRWLEPVRGEDEEACLEIGQRKHGGVHAKIGKCFGASGQVAGAKVVSLTLDADALYSF